MASRPVREVQALNIVTQELSDDLGAEKLNYASIECLEDLERIENDEPWVHKQVRTLVRHGYSTDLYLFRYLHIR